MEKNEILVTYGTSPADMAYRVAEAANLAELIGDRSKRIGLKPNLVVSRPAEEGATTHPRIVMGIIVYLQKNGFHNIAIMEGSWVGDSTAAAFSACGYNALAKATGVKLIDTQKDNARNVDCKGMKIEICESALLIDFMINVPVMKGHCQTFLTCALKNLKGVIPDREKRRFHTLGLHRPIAHLNTVARNDFIMVDNICGDLDFEEGGNPVYAGRIFAARDPVLCDAWAATLMGYRASDIPYIGMAGELGVGSLGPAVVRELNESSAAPAEVGTTGKIKRLTAYTKEDAACSACYAGLVFALSRMERSELSRLEGVCVGQGFRGKNGRLGVGQCTAAFDTSCPGCPPTGAEVLEFLRKKV